MSSIKILHSGSKAQYKGDATNPGLKDPSGYMQHTIDYMHICYIPYIMYHIYSLSIYVPYIYIGSLYIYIYISMYIYSLYHVLFVWSFAGPALSLAGSPTASPRAWSWAPATSRRRGRAAGAWSYACFMWARMYLYNMSTYIYTYMYKYVDIDIGAHIHIC